MEPLNSDYMERVGEVQTVIELISALEDERQGDLKTRLELVITSGFDSLVDILSSSVLVMLYNLIESTAVGCVEALYDELKDKNISYDQLGDGFKERVFKDLTGKKISSKDFIANAIEGGVGVSMISSSYNKESFFNGNVDARKIRETFKSLQLVYGSQSGSKLEEVKNARRKLTHSESSFGRYGRDFTYSDLRLIFNDVTDFFDGFLSEFSSYIESCGYLSEGL